MAILPLKKWFPHSHMPDRHQLAIKGEHLVHSERFWLIVTLAVLLALTIFFGILAMGTGGGQEQIRPFYPFVP